VQARKGRGRDLVLLGHVGSGSAERATAGPVGVHPASKVVARTTAGGPADLVWAEHYGQIAMTLAMQIPSNRPSLPNRFSA
jgi:hypothetical protein